MRAAIGVKGSNDRVDALALLCREVLRSSSLCMIGGSVYHFDGRTYASCSLRRVLEVLGNLLMDAGASPLDVRRMGEIPLSVIGEKVKDAGSAVCFENGVYRLADDTFVRGFSADVVTTGCLPYPFIPGATCPNWDAFLDEVLPDKGEQEALHEFFAMCFIDRTKLSVEKMALFIGSGANGKSVVCEVIKGMLGDEAVSNLDPAQLRDEKMLPVVKGKRLNFAPDVRKSSDFDSALKALASGQDVTARRIYGEAEVIKCPPIVFALNEMPYFRDTTAAFFRRLLVFSFDVTIPEERQDKMLASKIKESDLPGVFLRVMNARRALLQRGGEFMPTQKMRDAVESLRHEATLSAEHPVRSYLERRGLSPFPQDDASGFVNVTQNEILLGLKGRVSANAVTREMKTYGIDLHRGRESYYRVYQINTL